MNFALENPTKLPFAGYKLQLYSVHNIKDSLTRAMNA